MNAPESDSENRSPTSLDTIQIGKNGETIKLPTKKVTSGSFITHFRFNIITSGFSKRPEKKRLVIAVLIKWLAKLLIRKQVSHNDETYYDVIKNESYVLFSFVFHFRRDSTRHCSFCRTIIKGKPWRYRWVIIWWRHNLMSHIQAPIRDILMQDFEVVEIVNFPSNGTTLTPQHDHGDFTFQVMTSLTN